MAARFAELFSDLKPSNDIDSIPQQWQFPLLAMAQHYHIPTRLLDWSECADVAACFAVANNKKETEDKCAALYMFHDRTAVSVTGGATVFPEKEGDIRHVRPFRMYQDSIKYFELWRDIIGLDEAWRAWNQKAVLTVQPRVTVGLDLQLVEASLSPDRKPRYQKLWWLNIPAERKKPIREELKEKGITYDGVFIGPFEKLCRDVMEAFAPMGTECR